MTCLVMVGVMRLWVTDDVAVDENNMGNVPRNDMGDMCYDTELSEQAQSSLDLNREGPNESLPN